MTVPPEYQAASTHFSKFMKDLQEQADLGTHSQAYTTVQGVLQAFRRRLSLKEAILFANVLPSVLRAIFVSDWDVDQPRRPFEDRAVMTKEVQALRGDHNYAPDTAIRDVAIALRKNIDEKNLDRVLARLPEGAVKFWQV